MKTPKILVSSSNASSALLENITGDTDIIYSDQATAAAIIAAGGLPIYMPTLAAVNKKHIDDYLNDAEGVVITGEDANVDPRYYDELQIQSGRLDSGRDRVDIEIVKAAYVKQIPILAICKGMQVVNVALGGSLYQNVMAQHANALDHDISGSRASTTHEAILGESHVLSEVFGGRTRFPLNGGHQQGVRNLAQALRPVGAASDGIVEIYEGVEHPFLLGVQFHPELCLDDQRYFGIFEGFIRAALRRVPTGSRRRLRNALKRLAPYTLEGSYYE